MGLPMQPVPEGFTSEELNALFAVHGEIESAMVKEGQPPGPPLEAPKSMPCGGWEGWFIPPP